MQLKSWQDVYKLIRNRKEVNMFYNLCISFKQKHIIRGSQFTWSADTSTVSGH